PASRFRGYGSRGTRARPRGGPTRCARRPTPRPSSPGRADRRATPRASARRARCGPSASSTRSPTTSGSESGGDSPSGSVASCASARSLSSMQPRVIAILVAQGATEDLDETLAALAAQSSPPQSVVVIDTAPSEESDRLIAKHAPTVVVTASPGTAFGDAVAHALHAAPPPESDDELLWLLRDDSAPDPDALAQLLNALEIAPSVAIAGPKLLDAERPTRVAAFGETLSTLGESVQYVDGELDQGQFDT